MNIFNRLLSVLVFLVLIAILIGAIAAMSGYSYGIFNGYLNQEIEYLNSLEGWQPVVGIIVAVLLILIFAFFIFLEIPRPVEEKHLLLDTGESGVITMSRDSLERHAEAVGLQNSHVRDIRCQVRQNEEGLWIRCWPVLLTGTNINNLAPEIQQNVSQGVTEVTGIPVKSVELKARYEAPEKHPAEQVL